MWRLPLWVGPILMMLMNLLSVLTGLVGEQRVKINGVKFAVLYATTVPHAVRGDIGPFLQVLSMPGG